MGNGDVTTDISPQDGGQGQPVQAPPDLPLDFEGFYLGHQEFFHDFAEIHLGSRRTAEQVIHQVFLEILGGWDELLQQGDLEQQTLAVLHRGVTRRLEEDGRPPAFLINGPIAKNLEAVRSQLELSSGAGGLYEEILALPSRQFTVIVLRHLLGYPTRRIARYMGLDTRTVDYHGRKGKERLRIRLGLPATTGKNKKGTGQ
ncbi:sigma-70 family RNA polymerase sigma factor [Streptomyces afghaniensis]|uniref:sigma-70 family RNA polymerase sigma factor n=1 Tax=Streptomyces afghaniensis TaxID=66865 RepID=UPI002789073F|nr:sigma-70 family RNA polymerase sigma factor [Streptomyces afghaniensis]MDQ1015135.1 DNA-directed RNA polymerase specialized sigma24 family protein [Streptomyces afghaniensis]